MAKANTITKDGSAWRCVAGKARQVQYVTAAAIKQGDFVKDNGSGLATQALAAASAGSATSTGGVTIIGQALHDAASGATLDVLVADDNVEFHLRIYNSTASAAEPQDVSQGTSYMLSRYTASVGGGALYMMGTGTTNPEVKVMEKSIASAVDDDYGFIWGKINRTYQALT